MLDYVYLMRAGDVYKIGRSRDPGYRRYALARYAREHFTDKPLFIVHTIRSANALALERRFKLAFRPWRIENEFEWFRLPPGAAAWIRKQREPVGDIPDFTPAPAPPHVPDPLVSPAQAAQLLGVDPRVVRQWMADGRMAYVVLGSGTRRVFMSEVRRIDEQKKLR